MILNGKNGRGATVAKKVKKKLTPTLVVQTVLYNSTLTKGQVLKIDYIRDLA